MPKPTWNALQARKLAAPTIPTNPQPSIIPVKNGKVLQGRYGTTDGGTGYADQDAYKKLMNSVKPRASEQDWGTYYDYSKKPTNRGGGGDGYVQPLLGNPGDTSPVFPASDPTPSGDDKYVNPYRNYVNPYEGAGNAWRDLLNQQQDPGYGNYYKGLMDELKRNENAKYEATLKEIASKTKANTDAIENQKDAVRQDALAQANDINLSQHRANNALREAQANRGQLDSGLSRQESLIQNSKYNNARSNVLMNRDNNINNLENNILQAQAAADTERLNAETQRAANISAGQNSYDAEQRSRQENWDIWIRDIIANMTSVDQQNMSNRADYDTKMAQYADEYDAADKQRQMEMDQFLAKLRYEAEQAEKDRQAQIEQAIKLKALQYGY